MSAQSIHPHAEPDRVPRNAEGIAASLEGERRMEFYRELLAAAPEDAEGVLRRWWCEAMLDTDPACGRVSEAALNGTLPTKSVAAAIARRQAAGLPVE
ncbi:hypothetical protein ADL28_44445 [Streptomyces violaceusniger]|uniref:Uncharacterized protein n=3 Tax=Streptomyces TaxID=1883 RepID=A0ABD5JQ16_9ACTN|nr:hypothetical protein [Streptomyces violaceusniger]KUL42903.1 hypothetical protein ADL28_44445 [Streptomyces violaceusniger]MEE4589209.1 hypothetical protein [Streptomyces sp. DSM 41602]